MTRTSMLIAALTLIAATMNASAAEPRKTASAKPCTYEEFMTNCRKNNAGTCERAWGKQQRMGGNCMR
jgi:hypothetical protein